MRFRRNKAYHKQFNGTTMDNIFRLPAILLLSAIMFSWPQNSAAQNISVKTNALLLGALTPNLGCELVTGEKTSVQLVLAGHKNPYGFTSEIFCVRPEFRYWFGGRPMVREFIGVQAILATYDMTFKNQVFNGDAVGAGLTGGYAFPLAERWNLELSCGIGVAYYHQKKYFSGDNYDDYFIGGRPQANSWGWKLIPTELGITFTYIIK